MPQFSHEVWKSAKIGGTKPAMCKNPASILGLRAVDTSHDFFAPRGVQRQLLVKPQNDRGKMASHIVSLYLALLNFTNFSRRTPSTQRKFKAMKDIHASP